MAGSPSSPDPSDPLLPLLDQIADLPESQQSIAIEAACRERPDLEPALRRHFSAYRELAGRSAAAPPLQQIGPYRLLEVVGEGGMGVVYRAEQSAPIRRTVALQVIKGGHDDRRVVARFERERQALALMNHEGIAKVFDCGTTASGQPFFVMELVAGEPITRYCARRRSTVRATEQIADAGRAVGGCHGDAEGKRLPCRRRWSCEAPRDTDFGGGSPLELPASVRSPVLPRVQRGRAAALREDRKWRWERDSNPRCP